MFRDEIRTGWACSAIDDQTLGAQNWTISTIYAKQNKPFVCHEMKLNFTVWRERILTIWDAERCQIM